MTLIATNGITVAIVILNSILKTVNTALVDYIKYPYNSDVISTVVVSVFISQFINTAFVLPLASANLKDTPLKFLGPVADNLYKDFNLKWYEDVGS